MVGEASCGRGWLVDRGYHISGIDSMLKQRVFLLIRVSMLFAIKMGGSSTVTGKSWAQHSSNVVFQITERARFVAAG